jgi:hypothetical protein
MCYFRPLPPETYNSVLYFASLCSEPFGSVSDQQAYKYIQYKRNLGSSHYFPLSRYSFPPWIYVFSSLTVSHNNFLALFFLYEKTNIYHDLRCTHKKIIYAWQLKEIET